MKLKPVEISQQPNIIIGDGAIGHDLLEAFGGDAILCARSDWGKIPFENARVWIAVKYRNILEVFQKLNRYAQEIEMLLVTSNGLGVAHLYAEAFGAQGPKLVRVLFHYGVQLRDGIPQRAGSRKASVAPLLHLRDSQVAGRILSQAGFEVIEEKNIAVAEWKKIGINTVVNSLATLARAKNRVIIEDDCIQQRAKLLLGELREIASKEGFFLKELEYDWIESSIRHHGENVNSSLQDLSHGKRPEILDFLGSLECLAKTHGVYTPTLVKITEELQQQTAESQAE